MYDMDSFLEMQYEDQQAPSLDDSDDFFDSEDYDDEGED